MKTTIRKGIASLAMFGLVGASLAMSVPAQAQSPLGKIYGVAFIDANANGKVIPVNKLPSAASRSPTAATSGAAATPVEITATASRFVPALTSLCPSPAPGSTPPPR